MAKNSHRIPIAAPGRAYESQKVDIDAAIAGVMNAGHYIQGKQCQAFEDAFANWLEVKHGIAVASGTDALSIALQSAGLRSGDGIITAGNTAGATIAAIQAIGCVPILADIDAHTLNICPQSARRAFLQWKDQYSIQGIIPVHMYGQAAAMDAILELANEFSLQVVEDAAQAHGAAWNQKPVGGWGHAAAFSFYPTKNLGAFGDAGMLVTSDTAIEETARELRQYGWRERQVSYRQGINSRMDEIQAAILNTRLKRLPEETKRRQDIAQRYSNAFEQVPDLRCPSIHPQASHVYHQYVLRHPQRDNLAKHLDSAGIDTAVLYPKPIHKQPAWSELPLDRETSLRHCEEAAREILSIPIHPFLTDSEVEHIIESVQTYPSE